jgi:hypothetical protein
MSTSKVIPIINIPKIIHAKTQAYPTDGEA